MPLGMFRVSRLLTARNLFASVEQDIRGRANWLTSEEPYAYLAKEIETPLHPIIQKAYVLALNHGELQNWVGTEAIAKEWPHRSKKNPLMISYVENPLKGAKGIHGEIGLGRYIKGRFPSLSDKNVEFLVQATRAEASSTFEIVTGGNAIAAAISKCTMTGPKSCMAGPDKGFSERDHPYRVFTEKWGWGMACRYEGTELKARALVNDMQYVRIYGPTREDQFANPEDARLKEWLDENGYTKRGGWGGETIAFISMGDNEFLAPYIDGNATYGTIENESYIDLESSGEYHFDSQGGTLTMEDQHEGQVETANGDWIDEDDAIYIDGDGYYPYDECVRVNEEWALRCNCTELYNGEWGYDNDVAEIESGPHEGEQALDSDLVEMFDGTMALSEYATEVEYGEHKGLHFPSDEATYIDDVGQVLKEDCVQLKDGRWVMKDSDHAKLERGEVRWVGEDEDPKNNEPDTPAVHDPYAEKHMSSLLNRLDCLIGA